MRARTGLLLQKAATNRVQAIKNEHVLAGGATGIRTPDLLHAMQLKRPGCQGISGFYLRN
jgi:hypothetical protein